MNNAIMPYTLGIPVRQQRRANQVLRHSKSEPIEFEATKQDKDFYIFSFEVDYDDFQEIVIHLKQNGVTTIGADEQLTERKIMKLTHLLEQKYDSPVTGMENPDGGNKSQGFEKGDNLSSADDIIDRLKYILQTWETKEYNSDKERYEEYYMDIEDLVTDFEENQSINRPDTNLEESYQLKDFFINENVETLMVKLGGDAKTQLRVSNQTNSVGDIDLSNVTLEFKDKKYEGLNFEHDEDIEGEDHGEEGKDVIFVAKAEDGTIFEVEVNAEANFEMSGRIQDVEWRSLETFPSEEDQQGIEEGHCTEQEIAEGTCGYGKNGELGDKPAGPSLLSLVRESIKMLKKQ